MNVYILLEFDGDNTRVHNPYTTKAAAQKAASRLDKTTTHGIIKKRLKGNIDVYKRHGAFDDIVIIIDEDEKKEHLSA